LELNKHIYQPENLQRLEYPILIFFEEIEGVKAENGFFGHYGKPNLGLS
jgi:hypothetical protein